MKVTKKKMTFVLSVVFVSLLALGYRTMLYFVGLRNVPTTAQRSTSSCGVPVAFADVPTDATVDTGSGEGGGGEGGCG